MKFCEKFIAIAMICFMTRCHNREFGIESYGYTEEGTKEFHKSMESFKDTVQKNVFVFFPSNPYLFDSSYKIIVFDKLDIAYYGKYSDYFYIPKPKQDKEGKSIANYTILMCKEYGDKVRKYLFKNDNAFIWKDEYCCLYIDINPTNPPDNNTFLFPSSEKIYK